MLSIWTILNIFVMRQCVNPLQYNPDFNLPYPRGLRVPHGSVVKCLTRNCGFEPHWILWVFSWGCPWARHFRTQPSTGETLEASMNVSCRRDMTEILLKAA